MDETIQRLKDTQVELLQEATGIVALADQEKRRTTPEELTRLQEIEVESARLGQEIDHRQNLAKRTADLARPQGRRSDPAPFPQEQLGTGTNPMSQPVRLPAQPRSTDGRLGFKNLGEFAQSVQFACLRNNTRIDPRLEQLAPGTYGNEAVGSDGGFAVPPDYRAAIMTKVMGPDSLLDRTSKMVTASNQVNVPTDESTPWGTTGVRAFWTGEAAQLQPTKPALQKTTYELHKLTALVNVTDELLKDAPALESYLKQRTPVAINWKVNEAILNGTGVGMPLGILKSGAKVRVTKVSGQAADTVLYDNVLSMYSRMYGPWRSNAVWIVNQDVEPQLAKMYLPTGNTGAAVYLPPGGVSQAPYATLFGRPIIPVENAQQLGDEGDIMFAALSEYQTITQVEPIRAEVSIHLYFDWDITAFRWIMRLGGRPIWSAPITRAHGTNTLGAFITLEDR